MIGIWGDGATWKLDKATNPHEANYLKLDSSKARMKLNWQSRMTLDESLHELTTWYKNYYEGKDMIEVTRQQITNFENK
jgi:CDP-glucose 4,6-dehydratase